MYMNHKQQRKLVWEL